MTFEEYRRVLKKLGYHLKTDYYKRLITVLTRTNDTMLAFGVRDDTDSFVTVSSGARYYQIKDLTLLYENTSKLLQTPLEERGELELTTYKLVIDDNDREGHILGYSKPHLWKLGTKKDLDKAGYQITFTDDELRAVAGDNKELLAKLDAIKERL